MWKHPSWNHPPSFLWVPEVRKGLPHSGKSIGQRYTLAVIHPHAWKHLQIPSVLHWRNKALPGHLWWGIIKVCHIRIKYHKQITRCESKWSIGLVLQPKHNIKRQRMSGGLPVWNWTGVALKRVLHQGGWCSKRAEVPLACRGKEGWLECGLDSAWA